MFADAIEKVSKYTRPIKAITRLYDSTEIIPGAATLFFVNEQGTAITCKHVAQKLLSFDAYNKLYNAYKSELAALSSDAEDCDREAIKAKYGSIRVAQQKCMVYECFDGSISNYTMHFHPKYDLAIIQFSSSDAMRYSSFAVFAKDSSILRRGEFLCRYGYPFVEFTDYTYDEVNDDIIWTVTGRKNTPPFPIEGMYTRDVADEEGRVFEYELSTPGLKGQSGGPLFDSNGIVFGMQAETASLHLGFDQDNVQVRVNGEKRAVNDYPFLHVGRCVTVDVIKTYLSQHGIKYYVGDSSGAIEVVNGEKSDDGNKNV